MRTSDINTTCCLCGEAILPTAESPDDALSMDHVPPKQFHPKEIRSAQNPNLWVVPTHNAGLFPFAPFVGQLEFDKIIRSAGLPGSKIIGAPPAFDRARLGLSFQ